MLPPDNSMKHSDEKNLLNSIHTFTQFYKLLQFTKNIPGQEKN